MSSQTPYWLLWLWLTGETANTNNPTRRARPVVGWVAFLGSQNSNGIFFLLFNIVLWILTLCVVTKDGDFAGLLHAAHASTILRNFLRKIKTPSCSHVFFLLIFFAQVQKFTSNHRNIRTEIKLETFEASSQTREVIELLLYSVLSGSLQSQSEKWKQIKSNFMLKTKKKETSTIKLSSVKKITAKKN